MICGGRKPDDFWRYLFPSGAEMAFSEMVYFNEGCDAFRSGVPEQQIRISFAARRGLLGL